jgi:peroxiredoxin family protein
MESSVFFTFWGLFAIVKPGVRITGDNWMQKMMSAMNPGSAQKAKLSHYHFAGAGPAMFKKLASDRQVAKPEELIALPGAGRRLIPCQMTMDLLGLKREDLLDGLEEPIGAATAILEMREAAVSLFIARRGGAPAPRLLERPSSDPELRAHLPSALELLEDPLADGEEVRPQVLDDVLGLHHQPEVPLVLHELEDLGRGTLEDEEPGLLLEVARLHEEGLEERENAFGHLPW